MSFVLDNSVTMRWCFGDGKPSDLAYASRVMDGLRVDTAKVPAIRGFEVANVLVRAEKHGLIDATHSGSFLVKLGSLPIDTDADSAGHALDETLALARRHGISAYDAAYLELATRVRAPLATLDKNLRNAAKCSCVEIF